jgi:hypothetical protein
VLKLQRDVSPELKLRRIGVGGSGLEYCYLRLEKLGDKNLHFYNLLENIKKQDLTLDPGWDGLRDETSS